MNIKLPELLAPAGNMERLLVALRYGADAVYLGAKKMSLRNFADNFSMDEIHEACNIAHQHGKRIYVALNAFARDDQILELPPMLNDLQSAGVDALIVNDPGVIMQVKETIPEMELHLSTQANTLNSKTAAFWHQAGIKRVVLARELSIAQMEELHKNIPVSLELEAFVHGAMCISYSGRCLLSNYINDRDANRGECAQPCRWTYELRETGSNGEYFTIQQDDKGSFLLNSRDMNLLSLLPQLIHAGIDSFKIEGRMKSIYYVAGVVNAYRMALDRYKDLTEQGNAASYDVSDLELELEYVSHRPYYTGFALGDPGKNGQYPKSAAYVQQSTLVAQVLKYDAAANRALLQQRNRFFEGEALRILAPKDIHRSLIVQNITDAETGERMSVVPQPKRNVWIDCLVPVSSGDILRRIHD